MNRKTAVCIVTYGDEFIILKRVERPGDTWSGQYCLPGGFLKDGETIEEGALRELQEETGIHRNEVTFSGSIEPLSPMSRRDVIVYPLHFKLADKVAIHTGEEHVWSAYVKFSELSLHTEPVKGNMFLVNGVEIWGLTYRILRNFMNGSGFHDLGS